MVLIDGVESFDQKKGSLGAFVKITAESPFFVAGGELAGDGEARIGGGVPSWVAIEYMAQTAAALVSRLEHVDDPGASPKPGLLLGTRRLVLDLPRFDEGSTYHVRAEVAYSDASAAAFDCKITDDAGRVVSTAVLNAYRPDDFSSFLSSFMI